MKTAVIFGITGQDGYYLTKLLLELQDYIVVGVKRRSSSDNTVRLHSLLSNKNLALVEGDITDSSSVDSILCAHKPDEVYNLAAQSHVQTSFDQPQYTFNVCFNGVLNILECLRKHLPKTRFYQASTSEMFGDNVTKVEELRTEFGVSNAPYWRYYQDEATPFSPMSPYAVAKAAAHHLVNNYRKAYSLHASCGILFNHECFKYDYPFIIRTGGLNGLIECKSIEDIALSFGFNEVDNKGGTPVLGIEVWDRNGWTKIKTISWFKNNGKKLRLVNARNSVYAISEDHVCFKEDGSEIESKNLVCGDRVENIKNYPCPDLLDTSLSKDEAELLGLIIGDGHKNKTFTNSNPDIRERFNYLWRTITGGTTSYYPSTSGFTKKIVGRLDLRSGNKWLKKFQIYTECKDVFGHKYKSIPRQILNSNLDIMEAFLIGYNTADGLKKNPCVYKFKNFKTNSPILAAGLLYLIDKVTGQKFNINIDESFKHGKRQQYYSLNLLSPQDSKEKASLVLIHNGKSEREIQKLTGISRSFIRKVRAGYTPFLRHYLFKQQNEIKKIIDIDNYGGWFFDLETETTTLHAGLGMGIVHNSPLRGDNFVTQKIAKFVGESYKKWGDLMTHADFAATSDKLQLGNLDAKRDWGHASDYVKAMWLMLQRDEPDDYVVATGETHSVREFCELAFNRIDCRWTDWVESNQAHFRPSEVPYLLGEADKAKLVLGWTPLVSFQELVNDMVDAQL